MMLLLSILLLSPMTTTAGHSDERALVDFRAKITTNYGVLASWNSSTSYCSWEGVTCGRRRRVVALDLHSHGLMGTISPAIGNLTFLRALNLSFNSLHGGIPPNIGSLRRLWYLDLRDNSLVGAIPSNISRCTSLKILVIADNQKLQGSIPAEIGNMPMLTALELYNNSITGTIPPSLGNLSRLAVLSLKGNHLQGSIPEGIGSNPQLWFLQLSINNLSGLLPHSLYNLSSSKVFYAAVNNLHGHLPEDLGRSLPKVQLFGLSEWGFLTSLTNCSRLQVLSIGWNRFAGKLPSSVANLSTSIQLLRIRRNNIAGVIPSGIGNLIGLQQLILGENLLTGAIPVSIGKLTQMIKLYLGLNNFSGTIPSSIGNLSDLFALGINSNNMEGSIPPSFGNLKKLIALDLSSNHLRGSIPNEIMNLTSISAYLLALSGNQLSGKIPDTISNCIVLEILLMDGNSFQGNIPPAFKNMKGLAVLNLTSNKLNGSIPGELGSITNLEELYLAHNNLSGEIPELFGNSTSLIRLDLSFNNLQGEVPKEGVFKNLTGLSIVGNKGLCGGIPQLHLQRCPNSAARKNKKAMPMALRIAVPAVGAILVLFSGLALAVFLCKRSQATTTKEQQPPPFIEIDLPMVSYNELLKATDGFSEANLLGKGRYGSVYRGNVENQGIVVVVAVKVFNLQQPGSYKSFKAECEALRRVRHRCLVKIITSCSSIDHQGQDFRALIFEFMPNGSLDNWVHSDTEKESGNGTLTMEQRLDIAVDIVDAIEYLHNGCQTSIIHCDLKPSNILLTHDMRAHVGDFGIARIINEAASTSSNSNSSIGIRGSIGYVAPEYGEGLAVSTYGDVYSLGITLIEMFTGRSPTDDMFRDGLNLHYFAKAAHPDNVMEIADSRIWLRNEGNNRNATRDIARTKECLAAIIQLGVLCSKQSPKERLLISDAAVEMHNIRNTFLSAH
ncbi:hypothetical protein BDA96_10G352700 [Sorghum bicolor]|uniref:Receptor kinase-like protein Xa21 n=1 Tax=Sorghum bicolor TaxID=4558 RepID=A0A921Q656_SORBI|nr:hypothetical protein BDA96_10G352700 [Sorghum bicolor]